jgi:hypothetical protein
MLHIIADITWLKDSGDWLGALWPYFAILGGILGLGYRVLKKMFENSLHVMIQTEIRPLHEQFRNNGGSSMRDAVDRVEKKVDSALEEQKNMKDDQSDMKDDLSDMKDTLRRHTDSDAENFNAINQSVIKILTEVGSK